MRIWNYEVDEFYMQHMRHGVPLKQDSKSKGAKYMLSYQPVDYAYSNAVVFDTTVGDVVSDSEFEADIWSIGVTGKGDNVGKIPCKIIKGTRSQTAERKRITTKRGKACLDDTHCIVKVDMLDYDGVTVVDTLNLLLSDEELKNTSCIFCGNLNTSQVYGSMVCSALFLVPKTARMVTSDGAFFSCATGKLLHGNVGRKGRKFYDPVSMIHDHKIRPTQMYLKG